MRVLHLIKTSTGAVWALRMVRELIRMGITVDVILPEDGPMIERYKSIGAGVYFLECDFAKLTNPFSFIRAAKKLRNIVNELKPDLVHSHFVGTTLTMRIALRGIKIPRLFQVPGVLHLENKVTRSIEIFLSDSMDYWMASCQRTKTIYIAAGISPMKVGMSHYGIDTTNFKESVQGVFRKEMGFTKSQQLVGMVAFAYAPKRWLGYKRGIKGHEDLIDALAIVREKKPDVIGIFVGGPWADSDSYFEQIRNYAESVLGGGAIFTGVRHDVPQLYPDFNVVVHPSHSENLGGAVESMAAGVPTIATEIGGFPDIVKNGVTGWLVPARTPAAIASAIIDVLDNPTRAHAIALAGQHLILKELDIRKTSEEVASNYESIINNMNIKQV